jgi:hypothetical protein
MTRDSSGGYDTAMQTTPPGYECIFATLYTYVYFQTNRPKEVGGTDRCVSLFCGGILAAGTSWLHRHPHDFYSGANPTIASYNASVVNFFNATGSLARFENKKNFILL